MEIKQNHKAEAKIFGGMSYQDASPTSPKPKVGSLELALPHEAMLINVVYQFAYQKE